MTDDRYGTAKAIELRLRFCEAHGRDPRSIDELEEWLAEQDVGHPPQEPIKRRRGRLRANWRVASASTTPISCRAFEDDFEACIAHLRLPVTHRRFIRTTNLLERLFVEERRRLKIIPTGSARNRCSNSCSAL